ncbi:MAG TPA: hypothetical protein PLL75_01295 [Candidatus Omnitrophota bacterium]|nr:hypothetical protein [Candidatus Omnitrophota bacterium]HPS36349.1 hypothetical protein [Candidatus Omnitrophota bacterium]
MKKPSLACFYSLLIPGLGQLYLNEKAKGLTLLCMDLGILVSVLVSRSWVGRLMMGLIYLAIVFPSAVDAYQCASGKPRTFSGDSVPYVILMLLVVGPFAVPLLWQSGRFSKGAKIGWTVFVIVIALFVILAMTFLASFFDEFMKQNSGAVSF